MRRTAVLLGVVLIVAAPIAATVLRSGADRAAREEFAKLARGLPGLSAVNVSADPWRQEAAIEGLTFRGGGLVVRVGRISLPFGAPQSLFASAAYAQDVVAPAGTISAENISIDVGAMHYTIKSIELSGTSLTKADLDSIFDPKSTLSVADRIGKFSASQITIPEIAMQTTLGAQTENDSYRDIVFNDVVNGRAGNLTIGSLTSNLTSAKVGTMQTTYGSIKMVNLDLSLSARIVSQARKSDSEPRGTLYDSLEIGSGKIVVEKSNLEIDMGELSASGLRARPLRIPPASAAALLAAQDADSKRQAKAFIADVLDSFELERLDIVDLRVTVTDKDASGTGTLGHMWFSRMAHAKIAGLGFENIAVEAQGSAVKIGALVLHDIDLGALRDLAESKSSATPASNESLIGEIGLIGLDVDMAAAKTAAEGGRRTRFQLGKLDLISANPVNGIPSDFSTLIDHFTLDVKDAAGQLDELAALGYARIDLSSRVKAHFEASKQELGVEDLALSGMDMGAVRIACSFGNVKKDLFSKDPAQMEAAALSILVRRVEIDVEDGGLLERLIAASAEKTNKSLDQTREDYANAAAANVADSLGDGPQAKEVATSIAKFIGNPRNLRIVATAPDGIGVAELALVKDPNILMNKLSIEASNE